MIKKSIYQIHAEKTGKVSDKWESYLEYYDGLFRGLRDLPISMLEIGVQNGGSLETWANYFVNAKNIVGCDIDEKCKNLAFEDGRINVVVGNANSEETNSKIRGLSNAFDIIIDDGSHISHDVLNSFFIYFPLLAPGGIYIVEDAHTLYQSSFGGGMLNDVGAMCFFKKLVDFISYQFWEQELLPNVFFSTFFGGHSIPLFIAEGWVDSMEFKNSIITIKKAKTPGHQKLGKRLVSGGELTVKDSDWLNLVKG